MCRTVKVDVRWDDEHAHSDVGQAFDATDSFDSLTHQFEEALISLFEEYVNASVDVRVGPIEEEDGS